MSPFVADSLGQAFETFFSVVIFDLAPKASILIKGVEIMETGVDIVEDGASALYNNVLGKLLNTCYEFMDYFLINPRILLNMTF